MKRLLLIIGFACMVFFPEARAESYHVILCGSGGEPEFAEKFYDWGTRLEDAIVNRLEVPESDVFLLTEAQDDGPEALATTSLESIQSVLEIVRERSTSEDDVYVYFIGHGSYFNSIARFHIPGPDLTAEWFGTLIDEIDARNMVIVNGASSSAAFINVLSAPGRIICTATKSATEYNATEFMGFWVEALEDGSADRDRDERISLYELCQQAAELTDAWYIGNGYISTEHALLDDNADGLGTRLTWDMVAGFDPTDPKNARLDGALARNCYLKNYSFPDDVPQEWIDAYLDALDEVRALKKRKHELEPEEYYAELERFFLEAARANQKIRAERPSDGPNT